MTNWSQPLAPSLKAKGVGTGFEFHLWGVRGGQILGQLAPILNSLLSPRILKDPALKDTQHWRAKEEHQVLSFGLSMCAHGNLHAYTCIKTHRSTSKVYHLPYQSLFPPHSPKQWINILIFSFFCYWPNIKSQGHSVKTCFQERCSKSTQSNYALENDPSFLLVGTVENGWLWP